jgi:TPR repeat protein
MANVGIVILVALCISIVGSRVDVKAQALQPITPKAAQEYASDSEKASYGDPDAAYRIGQALESGRLGGVKNLNKALTFYKLAAQKGHQLAAARAAQIEAELGQSHKEQDTLHSALHDTSKSQTAPKKKTGKF